MDGSSPSHHRSFGGSDHGVTCSTEAAAEVPKQGPEPIVLDDMDLWTVHGSGQMTNAYAGTYRPCREDAYKGQFHHDWARNKGGSSVAFKFKPPSAGCYAIEEHHPGSNQQCAYYLPTNARLDVDYNQGMSSTFRFNQAQNGGKWSKLGSLMFQEGSEAFLKMQSSPDEICAAGNCFWLVDAFRLTWTGDQCTGANAGMKEGALVASSGNDDAATTPPLVQSETTKQLPVQREVIKAKKEGILRLRVSWAETGTHGVSDSLHLELQKHESAIQATLTYQLGYSSASILSIAWSPGRRLNDHGAVALNVFFVAHGKINDEQQRSEELKQTLQANLDLAQAGVTVESADVDWVTVRPGNETNATKTTLIVGVGMVIALVVVGAGILCLIRRKRQMSTGPLTKVEVCKDEFVAAAVVVEAPKDLEKMKDVEEEDNASVSTGTPMSEPKAADDCTSSDGNSVIAPETLGDEIAI